MPVPGSEALFARLRPFALAERSESDTPRFVPDVGERSCSSRERRTARLEARASRAAIPSPRSGCRAVVSFAGRVRSCASLDRPDSGRVTASPGEGSTRAKGATAGDSCESARLPDARGFAFSRHTGIASGIGVHARDSTEIARATGNALESTGLQGLCSLCSPVDSEVVYATRGSVTVCTFAATGSALAKGAAAATESRAGAPTRKRDSRTSCATIVGHDERGCSRRRARARRSRIARRNCPKSPPRPYFSRTAATTFRSRPRRTPGCGRYDRRLERVWRLLVAPSEPSARSPESADLGSNGNMIDVKLSSLRRTMIFSGNPSGAGPVPFPRAAADRDPFRSLAVSDCARSALARAINARWASQVRHRVDLGLDSDARLRALPKFVPAGFQKRFSDRRRVRQSKRTAQISLYNFAKRQPGKAFLGR